MRLTKQIETIFRYQTGLLNAGVPSQVYWVITDECNLKCCFCNFWKGIYKRENKNILSTQKVKALISKISKAKIPYILFTGGEPFLREDLLEILEYSQKRTLHTRVQTNGTLLTEEKIELMIKNNLLDEIWLSLDGIGSTHDYLRGENGVYQKVIEVLDKVNYFKVKYSKVSPYMVVHTAVTKFNVGQLGQILDICLKYKVGEWFLSFVTDISDKVLKQTNQALDSTCFYSLQMRSEENLFIDKRGLCPSILNRIFEARRKGLNVFIDPLLKGNSLPRPQEKCILLWTSLMLSPYGEVLVCPMLDKYILGDLLKDNLMDLWNSEAIKKIRQLVMKKELSVCQECCVQRRTLFSQLKDPSNLKRVFMPRRLRELSYKFNVHLP